MNEQRQSSGTSPWVWIGCGCAAAIVLFVAVIGGLGWLGLRQARQLAEDMADPEARATKALEVMGAELLPGDYNVMVAMSVPLVMKMAILTDLEPDTSGEINGFGDHGFIYLDFIRLGDQEELLDFFEGRNEDPKALRQQGINVDLDERLATGSIDRSDVEILWVSHRGHVNLNQGSSQGINTLMLIECEEDKRRRLAIWFGPDPDPRGEAVELDLTGTTADASAIEQLMAPVHPCR